VERRKKLKRARQSKGVGKVTHSSGSTLVKILYDRRGCPPPEQKNIVRKTIKNMQKKRKLEELCGLLAGILVPVPLMKKKKKKVRISQQKKGREGGGNDLGEVL